MTTTRMVSAGIALVLAITFSLHAQEPAIMVPSAQPDSIVGIVSIVAEEQGLQLMSPDQVPLCGTFWTVLPGLGGGVIPSSPCPPLDPSRPIYQIADGQFLVDETGGQVAVNPRRFGLPAQATSSTAAAVVAAQADAVLNLINAGSDSGGKPAGADDGAGNGHGYSLAGRWPAICQHVRHEPTVVGNNECGERAGVFGPA